MTQLMMVWISTVSILLMGLLTRTIWQLKSASVKHASHHIVSIEKEANLIYCPGDIADEEDSDDL